MLKDYFKLENPQIEISEVTNVNLNPEIVAERIANSLERFGLSRFKGVGHKTMSDVMDAGALGIEILISGKVPSSRAKRWRFYKGYLKKCGQVAIDGVLKSYRVAQVKTGTVGITVKIMPPDVSLPDQVKPIEITEEEKVEEESKSEETKTENSKEDKKEKKSKPTKEKKKSAKKESKKTKPKATKTKKTEEKIEEKPEDDKEEKTENTEDKK